MATLLAGCCHYPIKSLSYRDAKYVGFVGTGGCLHENEALSWYQLCRYCCHSGCQTIAPGAASDDEIDIAVLYALSRDSELMFPIELYWKSLPPTISFIV